MCWCLVCQQLNDAADTDGVILLCCLQVHGLVALQLDCAQGTVSPVPQAARQVEAVQARAV